MNAAERKALFISHATPEDNHFVRWLGAKLTAMGYEVWADVMCLNGGDDWSRKLEEALRKRAAKVLLVCTSSGLDKRGVRNEIQMASDVARKVGDDAFIVPLRLEQYEAPFLVAHAQYIDFKAGWAQGLVQLTDLLRDIQFPRGEPGPMETWLESQSAGADKLVKSSEPLVSNWLRVSSRPETINFCVSPVGAPLEPFLNRQNHFYPAVPYRTGVITFALPDEQGWLGATLLGKREASIPMETFLQDGWSELGIEPYQARRIYSDLGNQAFDGFCQRRGLKDSVGTGRRVSWWGDIKTAPTGQVRFDWGYRRGSRQVVGQSGKRGVHWHYALNAQLRASPLWHMRLSPRLVFSENGLDAITDEKRSHTLRRSFAKGWRNDRWRDMLCAQLWWLAERRAEICLPVAADDAITLAVPPMQFGCPVTVLEDKELPPDEDDPDIPVDDWDDEQSEVSEA